jgi:hypothetical protein
MFGIQKISFIHRVGVLFGEIIMRLPNRYKGA